MIESKTKDYINRKHPFKPIYDSDSRILILGTIPSVKSCENGFYYANPHNAFWRIVSDLYAEDLPITVEDKTNLLLRHHIALWDVLKNCDIIASSDSSIRNEIATDIPSLLKKTSIQKIYANGSKAKEQYDKLVRNQINMDIILLPSTSPAYAKMRYEEKLEKWKVIKD